LAAATICIALVIWAVFLTDLIRRRMSRVLGMKLFPATSPDAIRRRGFPHEANLLPVFRQRRLDQLPDRFKQILN
jgi:hypothetical protein